MLAVRFTVFTTILSLLVFIYSATANPVCDPAYGHPSFSDCRDLVLTLYNGAPGRFVDEREHFFSLRGEEPPPWIPPSARGLRIHVPIFAAKG